MEGGGGEDVERTCAAARPSGVGYADSASGSAVWKRGGYLIVAIHGKAERGSTVELHLCRAREGRAANGYACAYQPEPG